VAVQRFRYINLGTNINGGEVSFTLRSLYLREEPRAFIRQRAGSPESGLDMTTNRKPIPLRRIECLPSSPLPFAMPTAFGSRHLMRLVSCRHEIGILLAYFSSFQKIKVNLRSPPPSKPEETIVARERLGKHVPVATNTHVKEELLGAVFYMRSMYQILSM
jgi:hypothetical protein